MYSVDTYTEKEFKIMQFLFPTYRRFYIKGKDEEKDRAQKQREILVNQKNEIDAKEEERQELKLKLPSYEKRDSLRSSLSKVQKTIDKALDLV